MRGTRLLLGSAAALVGALVVLLGGVLREVGPAAGGAAGPTLSPDALTSAGHTALQRVRETGDPTFYAAAERALRQARSLAPGDAAPVAGLASLAASRHRFGESLRLARRAVELAPHTARHHGLVGDALLELGRYDEAFAAFERMIELKPSAPAYARISYARELAGDLEGARSAMELAVSASPRGEPAAWSRTLSGNLLLAQRRLAAAERRFREALGSVPGYPAALAGLADAALARGDLERALPLLARAAATSRAPEYAAAHGDALALAGRAGAAERAWRRAEQLERLFAASGGRNLLETAEFDLNHDRNLRSALERARRGRAERPSVEGDHVLAWALYKNGLCAEAREASLRSLRLGTLDVDGLYHHALIERCLGDAAAAERYLARVRSLEPRYLETAASARRLPPPR